MHVCPFGVRLATPVGHRQPGLQPQGETGVAREEQGSPGPATDAPVLADGVVSKDDEKGAAEGAEERVELALGLAGTFVTLKVRRRGRRWH